MKKILIIGIGLIGGSFAKALKSSSNEYEISATDLNLESLEFALKEKIIDKIHQFPIDSSSYFDLIVISSPLSSYKTIFEKINNNISEKIPIIIDLGSVKNKILGYVPESIKRKYIGCHPIAGSHNSGIENSDKNLFNKKLFFICKNKINSDDDVMEIEKLLKDIKSIPKYISSNEHDNLYALISHLPQFLSFLTKDFNESELNSDFFKTSFRLDNSSPDIWRDIFSLNENNIEKFYIEFFSILENIIEKISRNEFKETLDYIGNDIEIYLDSSLRLENLVDEVKSFIIFRLLIVGCFLKIKEVKLYQNLSGQGFKDFILIINLLSLDKKVLENLLKKFKSDILKFFKSIS